MGIRGTIIAEIVDYLIRDKNTKNRQLDMWVQPFYNNEFFIARIRWMIEYRNRRAFKPERALKEAEKIYDRIYKPFVIE